MSTAQTPPPPPGNARAVSVATPEQELHGLILSEAQTNEFIRNERMNQERRQVFLERVGEELARQRANLDELRGFRRPVVSLALYRVVRTSMQDSVTAVRQVRKAMAESLNETKRAEGLLAGVVERRRRLERELVRGVIIPFPVREVPHA